MCLIYSNDQTDKKDKATIYANEKVIDISKNIRRNENEWLSRSLVRGCNESKKNVKNNEGDARVMQVNFKNEEEEMSTKIRSWYLIQEMLI